MRKRRKLVDQTTQPTKTEKPELDCEKKERGSQGSSWGLLAAKKKKQANRKAVPVKEKRTQKVQEKKKGPGGR